MMKLLQSMKPRDKVKSQIEDCNFDLVVSANSWNEEVGKETTALAKEISEHGLDVLLTVVGWPRDELFFHPDGTFDYVQKATSQDGWCPHEAYHGGKFLKGLDFIVASDSMIESKREETLRVLGIKQAFYLNLDDARNALSNISVSGIQYFYSYGNLKHIDKFFNLCNNKRKICTYDHPVLLKLAKEVSKKIDYDIIVLPIEDAHFASVCFVELGNHVAIDCRAEQTKKIIEDLGYNIIPSPKPMEKTNYRLGGIRCVCTEMPRCYDELKFYPFEGDGKEQGINWRIRHEVMMSIFWNLDNHRVVLDRQTRKLY